MQYKELSEKLTAVGRPIHPLSLKRIEVGERRVDVDDLVALALALEVSPLALLLPHINSGEDYAVSPTQNLDFNLLWDWAAGDAPLVETREAIRMWAVRSMPVNFDLTADEERKRRLRLKELFDAADEGRETEEMRAEKDAALAEYEEVLRAKQKRNDAETAKLLRVTIDGEEVADPRKYFEDLEARYGDDNGV